MFQSPIFQFPIYNMFSFPISNFQLYITIFCIFSIVLFFCVIFPILPAQIPRQPAPVTVRISTHPPLGFWAASQKRLFKLGLDADGGVGTRGREFNAASREQDVQRLWNARETKQVVGRRVQDSVRSGLGRRRRRRKS